MTKRRKRELIQAWVVVGAIALAWDIFGPEAFVHEFGHALFVILGGGQVTSFSARLVTGVGATDLSYYMGVGFGVLSRGLGMLWLIGKRRSVVLAAWLWGRMLGEWLIWWMPSFSDRHRMSSFSAAVTYTVIHGGMTLVFVVATSFAAYRLIVAWNAADPEHIENPSLFHAGQMSRL